MLSSHILLDFPSGHFQRIFDSNFIEFSFFVSYCFQSSERRSVNAYIIFLCGGGRKSVGKWSLGSPRRKMKYNVITELMKIGILYE
jgi:hypothetical protein